MAKVESDYNDFSSDEEESNPIFIQSKKKTTSKTNYSNTNDVVEGESSDEAQAQNLSDNQLEDNDQKHEEVQLERTKDEKKQSLAKKLAKIGQVKAAKKANHKTGVIYLSSIPPYMKPAKMRQILSRFGELDRLFLKRENDQRYRSRIKSGGNKKTMYDEGWAEFIRKRDAKLCATTLNGNIIGGKKGTFYHDDILNVKYLPGFKWADLTEQIARENDIRQAKLDLEIAQANKVNADFIRNVEKSKMIANIKSSRKRQNKEVENDGNYNNVSRTDFKQHKVSTTRADAPDNIKQSKSANIDNVLANIL